MSSQKGDNQSKTSHAQISFIFNVKKGFWRKTKHLIKFNTCLIIIFKNNFLFSKTKNKTKK